MKFALLLCIFGVSLVSAVRLTATATEYTWPGGGNSCKATNGRCGAVSDGWHQLWDNVWGVSKKMR